MRLISAVAAAALVPAFVALPTVSFAAAEAPRPVAPQVVNTAIGGVDPGELARSPIALPPAPGQTLLGAGPEAADRPEVLTSKRATARFTVAGVSWSRTSRVLSQDVRVHVRVKEDTGWTAWELLAMPDEGPDGTTAEGANARIGSTPLVSNGATGIQVRVDTATGLTPPDLKVSTIDPGTSAADDNLNTSAPGSASAATPAPAIITRAKWGADESLRRGVTYNSTVKAITIHHTAGTNNYTPAGAAAQVRGIYAYDTLGLGWDDIAYNFLVDKWGRVYEGRAGSITKAVRGAHSMGFNVDTMGISAMGNYDTTAAPAVMVEAMAKVAGWKLSQYGANPLGKVVLTSQGGSGAKYAAGVKATLDVIHPHRNTSYTICPGRYLYAQMATIRAKAASYARYSPHTPTPPTPAPAPVTTAKLYATYGKLILRVGSKGSAVRDAQRDLNRRGYSAGVPDGDFGAQTTTGVLRFQRAARLPLSGIIAANDWKALSGLAYTTAPKPPAPPVLSLPAVRGAGFDADGRGDVMGRTPAGDLYLYPGQLRSFSKPVRVGSGWNLFNTVLAAGDFTGDAKKDILGRTPAGKLYLYPGNGKGGFATGAKVIGVGWNKFNTILSPGDFSGDGKADILARTPAGNLYLYPGNGKGGFAGAGKIIGVGWNKFNTILSPGDFSGDGRTDILARTPAGKLYLYPGNGKGAFATGAKIIGVGWNTVITVLSSGDLTGDRKPDLLGNKADGRTYLYPGNGKGGYNTGYQIPVRWAADTRLFGVR